MDAPRKHALFIADSLDNAHKFRQVLSALGVDVSAGSSKQLERLLAAQERCELVVFEVRPGGVEALLGVGQALAQHADAPLLAIVRDEDIPALRLPALPRCDFVSASASAAECALRVRCLLAGGGEGGAECVRVDALTINLATYQVQISGEPVDLTYLEYALLSFLATHPGRTYSRDALLRQVWGFDYYGGSRTVDVHVRRVRAKLGPELAQHLETVRGVGYLWN